MCYIIVSETTGGGAAFMEEKVKLAVSAASGVESVVKGELKRLGFGETAAVRGLIAFDAAWEDIARLNVFLRAADRVYLSLASFPAETFDAFFDGVYAVAWEDYLADTARVTVDGKSRNSRLFALSALQSVAKKAIAERMKAKRRLAFLPETGSPVRAVFRIESDRAEIFLDTTGTGLHKRGYRDRVGAAPIRENLAAAMILLSDYYYARPFADPFCGSGTLAIEAALLAHDIAPGLNRRFDFENFPFYPERYLSSAKEEAKARERRERTAEIFAADIDGGAVELARRHARRAGVERYIRFKTADAAEFSSEAKNGVIVTNPPYGEKVLDEKRARELIGTLGGVYKKLDNWSLFAISRDAAFEKAFGRKADKTRKLYNSEKECRFYEYFSKREKKEDGR